MTKTLAHKKALITGGTRGIGHAIAERFLQEGAQVLVTGQNITIDGGLTTTFTL